MGAWIEIDAPLKPEIAVSSHPTWVRGLKLFPFGVVACIKTVAPHMGAWIEIFNNSTTSNGFKVAPHMGAWIEIAVIKPASGSIIVAPHMGAWIEISVRHLRRLA